MSDKENKSLFWDNIPDDTPFVGTISFGSDSNVNNDYIRNNRSFSFKSTFSIVKLVFLILLAISLFVAVSNGSPKSFESFIEYIANIELIPITDVALWFKELTIIADWGIFNFLRDIVNIITGAISLVAFLGITIVNFVPIIIGFISWAFA